MQNGIIPRTKGIVALERLQRDGYKVWTMKEIAFGLEQSLSKTQIESLFYIARENSMQRTPSGKDIREKFSLIDAYSGLRGLKRREMIFDFTMQELIAFYGFEILGYLRGHGFNPLPPLEWSRSYLSSIRGRRGDSLSWINKMKGPRSCRSFKTYYVGLLELEDGTSCYLPLGLHIPKSEIKIPAKENLF